MINILNAFEQTPPPLDFIWPGFLAGTVGALVAPGATGKSFFALQAAMAVASKNADLLALRPAHTGRVMYYAAEDPQIVLQHRLHAIGKHLNVVAREEVAERMQIKCVMGHQFNVMVNYKAVIDESKDCRLIIFDTLSRIHTLDENSNAEMAQLVSTLEFIARETAASVLFLHHISKASARDGNGADQHASRGASVLTDNARYCANLSKLSEKEAQSIGVSEEMRSFWLKLSISKQNYQKPIEDSLFRRADGGVLVPGVPAGPALAAKARKGGMCRDEV
jgi:RecA-family ATPase